MNALAGVVVAITRPTQGALELRALFQREGARVRIHPTIQTTPPGDIRPLLRAAGSLGNYDWVILTSPTGARVLCAALSAHPSGRPSFPSETGICAVGPATADALHPCGLKAQVVPERFVAESLLEELERTDAIAGRRFLLVQAAGARDLLRTSLRAGSGRVDVVEAYRTVPDPKGAEALAFAVDRGEVDLLTFTSGSSARSFARAWNEMGSGRERALPEGVQVAAIGPVTARVARGESLPVHVVASEHTGPGLVAACVRSMGEGGDDVS